MPELAADLGTLTGSETEPATVIQPPEEARPEEPSRGRGWFYEGIVAALLVASAIILAVFGHATTFGRFQIYDDEGYLLISVQAYNSGGALYDQVFSQYGPFYYVLHRVLYAPGLLAISHDHAGILTLAWWLLCAVLNGVFVYRLTGSALWAVLAQVLAFHVLERVSWDPGHPQAVATVMVTVLLALSPARGGSIVGMMMGALAGGILLTKINVGIFTLAALVLVLCSVRPGRMAAVGWVVTSAAILVLPLGLMRAHLGEEWGWEYAWTVTLSALPAICMAGMSRRNEATGRPALAVGLGLLVTVMVVLGVTMAHGTSAHGLLAGVLLQHARFPTLFYVNDYLHPHGIAAGTTSITLFAVYWFSRRRAPQAALVWRATLAKAVFAAVVLDTLCFRTFDSFLNFCLPFVWIAAIPVEGNHQRPVNGFARLLLVQLAILESLVAYPVAGSQQSSAMVFTGTAGVLCLADACRGLRQLVPAWVYQAPALVVVEVALALCLVGGEWPQAAARVEAYRRMYPLDLPGAHQLRLLERQTEALRWVSYNLRAYADTFVTLPGLNSFYFWSEHQPPTMLNATAWMTLLDDPQQEEIVSSLERYPNACAVRNLGITGAWLRQQSIEEKPLVRRIKQGFRTVNWLDTYEFRVRKDRPTPELVYCVHPGPRAGFANGTARRWDTQMRLPRMAGAVQRLVLISANGQALADTFGELGTHRLEANVRTAGSAERVLGKGKPAIALCEDTHWRLSVRARGPFPLVGLHVRLLDAEGNWLGSVPVLEGAK